MQISRAVVNTLSVTSQQVPVFGKHGLITSQIYYREMSEKCLHKYKDHIDAFGSLSDLNHAIVATTSDPPNDHAVLFKMTHQKESLQTLLHKYYAHQLDKDDLSSTLLSLKHNVDQEIASQFSFPISDMIYFLIDIYIALLGVFLCHITHMCKYFY